MVRTAAREIAYRRQIQPHRSPAQNSLRAPHCPQDKVRSLAWYSRCFLIRTLPASPPHVTMLSPGQLSIPQAPALAQAIPSTGDASLLPDPAIPPPYVHLEGPL